MRSIIHHLTIYLTRISFWWFTTEMIMKVKSIFFSFICNLFLCFIMDRLAINNANLKSYLMRLLYIMMNEIPPKKHSMCKPGQFNELIKIKDRLEKNYQTVLSYRWMYETIKQVYRLWAVTPTESELRLNSQGISHIDYVLIQIWSSYYELN